MSVDQLARPGAVVSGKVTFSDGITAVWQFDEMGQLRLAPQQPGYRPPASDLQQFQMDARSRAEQAGYVGLGVLRLAAAQHLLARHPAAPIRLQPP